MKLKLLFQFLIGMVSTRKKEKEEKKMKKLYFVSIPYRYGIYTKEKRKINMENKVSIPYRYGIYD